MNEARLYIEIPDFSHITYGLCIHTVNRHFLDKFYQLCNINMLKNENIKSELKPFVQGRCEDWVYIEFLDSSNQELILEQSLKISKEMNLSLHLGESDIDVKTLINKVPNIDFNILDKLCELL